MIFYLCFYGDPRTSFSAEKRGVVSLNSPLNNFSLSEVPKTRASPAHDDQIEVQIWTPTRWGLDSLVFIALKRQRIIFWNLWGWNWCIENCHKPPSPRALLKSKNSENLGKVTTTRYKLWPLRDCSTFLRTKLGQNARTNLSEFRGT